MSTDRYSWISWRTSWPPRTLFSSQSWQSLQQITLGEQCKRQICTDFSIRQQLYRYRGSAGISFLNRVLEAFQDPKSLLLSILHNSLLWKRTKTCFLMAGLCNKSQEQRRNFNINTAPSAVWMHQVHRLNFMERFILNSNWNYQKLNTFHKKTKMKTSLKEKESLHLSQHHLVFQDLPVK